MSPFTLLAQGENHVSLKPQAKIKSLLLISPDPTAIFKVNHVLKQNKNSPLRYRKYTFLESCFQNGDKPQGHKQLQLKGIKFKMYL